MGLKQVEEVVEGFNTGLNNVGGNIELVDMGGELYSLHFSAGGISYYSNIMSAFHTLTALVALMEYQTSGDGPIKVAKRLADEADEMGLDPEVAEQDDMTIRLLCKVYVKILGEILESIHSSSEILKEEAQQAYERFIAED